MGVTSREWSRVTLPKKLDPISREKSRLLLFKVLYLWIISLTCLAPYLLLLGGVRPTTCPGPLQRTLRHQRLDATQLHDLLGVLRGLLQLIRLGTPLGSRPGVKLDSFQKLPVQLYNARTAGMSYQHATVGALTVLTVVYIRLGMGTK